MGRRLAMPRTSIKQLRMGFGYYVHPEIHTELTTHSVLRKSTKSPTQSCLSLFPKSSKHWRISPLRENIMATPWQANYIFTFELEKICTPVRLTMCAVSSSGSAILLTPWPWLYWNMKCFRQACVVSAKLLHASKGWSSSRGACLGSFLHLLSYVHHEADSMVSK